MFECLKRKHIFVKTMACVCLSSSKQVFLEMHPEQIILLKVNSIDGALTESTNKHIRKTTISSLKGGGDKMGL